MLGRAAGRHGSCCGGPPGPDCVDHYKGKKAQRAHERRQWEREEEMDWRNVKRVEMSVPPAVAEHLKPENHAMEARAEGAFMFFRAQEEPGAEVFEYAIPAECITFVSFWPPKPPQS